MADTLPILVFKGDNSLCYGILTSFSEQLKDALISIGEEVIYVDPAETSVEELIGKRYKAIIAFMENIFYSVLDDGSFVFDSFYGPKFNYWTDYPAFYYRYVQKAPKDYYILTQDRNYVKFINRYYKNVRAFFLPPGGKKIDELIPFNERKYDLSFAGSFSNWERCVKSFNLKDETTKILVDNYLEFMVTNPDYTTEDAFSAVLEKLGVNLTDDQFVQELSKLHRLAELGVAKLYRQEILQTILDSGITVDVFGDSWKDAPFAGNKYLRIHQEIPADKVSTIYANSKMSLNIMTWHKDSITERVLDAMMARSIVISDYTPALSESFENEKEILFFYLNDITAIPDMVRRNIQNSQIADLAYEKAKADFSWTKFAERFLKIIEMINE